ncbi:zf-TFIIB domain-containing protein [Paenibacillus sp. VCA1]|uniref:TFIIB-type zinc ribbon-containing protein n=1 Tax=Paenibacillus sp. VCA1 TaxID=3039148 RepID=UPI0028723E7B|nr:zf-TFIIB domain-containing protein [Paenibacillus sp. VCA1]MDR9854289.1 zf-TFIIB domain-containing protein [Paenibacillus sp. VCA1]
MKCPICEDSRMKEVEKNGILIDICPTCKGVWLDRGELDKLMANVREERPQYNEWYYGDSGDHHAPKEHRQPSGHHDPPPKQHYPEYDKHGHSPYPYKKKKKSVLDVFGDLFD